LHHDALRQALDTLVDHLGRFVGVLPFVHHALNHHTFLDMEDLVA